MRVVAHGASRANYARSLCYYRCVFARRARNGHCVSIRAIVANRARNASRDRTGGIVDVVPTRSTGSLSQCSDLNRWKTIRVRRCTNRRSRGGTHACWADNWVGSRSWAVVSCRALRASGCVSQAERACSALRKDRRACTRAHVAWWAWLASGETGCRGIGSGGTLNSIYLGGVGASVAHGANSTGAA